MASVSDLLMEQARIHGDRRRSRGALVGGIVEGLSQVPGQILRDRAEQRQARAVAEAAAVEQARKIAHDKAVLQQGDARIQLDRDKLTGEQDAAEQTQLGQQRQRDAVGAWLKQHGSTVEQEYGAGAVDRILAVIQTPDGLKHTVEQLSKVPEPFTLIQRDPAKDLVNPHSGAVVTPGVPAAPEPAKPDTRALNVQFADAIRKGDLQTANAIRQAIRESESLGRGPQSATNPLDTQTEWAIPPGETEPRLMTKEEIRRTGAKRPAGADKPSSGQQRRVLNFFNRARQADVDLEGMEERIQGQGLAGQTWQAVMPNFLQTELGQQYTQAQRAFTEARLRKDSGAAIPDAEFESDRKTYFVEPGDSKETLEQKRRARATMLASLGFESGQALGEFLGNADEARAVVESYKTRSAKPAAATPKVGERRTINGKLGEWDGKGWLPVN